MIGTKNIAITGMGTLAPSLPNDLFSAHSAIQRQERWGKTHWLAPLNAEDEERVSGLMEEDRRYAELDRCVHLAMLASRDALKMAGWEQYAQHTRTGINIGSARGATGLIEKHHGQFIANPEDLSVLASPVTTAGAISSWVGADLSISGPNFAHSMTCSSGLFALGNALAWLHSNMANRFLAGGTEAPLTPFTLGQMNALKIYARGADLAFPCSPLMAERSKQSGLVVGEGAAVFAVEALTDSADDRVLAWVEGFGSHQEIPNTPTSISKEGTAFEKAMQGALDCLGDDREIDLLFMHAPGTQQGDQSELAAIQQVFGNDLPTLYSTKWQTGHLFGASGSISLSQAIQVFQHQQLPEFPYPVNLSVQKKTRSINRIMINCAGFGGNAVSLIIRHSNIKPLPIKKTHG